jgi:PAS domain-containing protein
MPDGRVTDWNPQACKLFGWRARKPLGRESASCWCRPSSAWRMADGFAHFARDGGDRAR